MIFKSPNQLLEQAQDAMELKRLPPEQISLTSWRLIMNCWARNLPEELVHEECRLLNIVYDSPLSELEVADIVQFQLRTRQEEGE